MQRRSPPKHRHDGTSPLPLGMDWSPPPRKWSGRDTVWPHDPRTGWSYCVTIPSWVVLPKSRDSDPVVFYRVQVGLQSPEGTTTLRGILRRFNDFLKLYSDLKKAFPKKNLPPAPPKGLLRMKSRALLEERRCLLEEWLTKLLSDIDLSRSVAVASFLELEAAARSSFQDTSQDSSGASPASDTATSSLQMPPNLNLSHFTGSSSLTSEYGSDTAYETSDIGTPRLVRDESLETSLEDLTLDEDLTSPIEKLVKYGMSNIDEGLFMGQTILEQLEGFPRHKPHARHINNALLKDGYNGNVSKASLLADHGMELFSEPESGKLVGHVRKLSGESVGSDGSSLRGSEVSNSGMPNLSGNGSLDLPRGTDGSSLEILGNTILHFSDDAQIILPLDQRHKMNRVLLTMQRRLVTAKTDMEDLIARLHQEIAVKDYLSTKVKDLEVELHSTKEKNKENLQQAILIERERLTQMQWDMEEMRRKSLEMELKLKSKEDERSSTGSEVGSTNPERDTALEELDATRKQLEDLSKRYEELEAKSKADIKFLAKEFKSLKNAHAQLKQELSQSLEEKIEVEKLLQKERELTECEKNGWKKLLHDCSTLHNRLQASNLSLSGEDDDKFIVADSLDKLTTSDDQIGALLAEAQPLFDDKGAACNMDISTVDGELRKTLAKVLTDNAKLRKQLNFVVSRSLQRGIISGNSEEAAPTEHSNVER
ncbi:hypothetical protein Tsubulata_016232 [Turnera subulata]|uniref:PX domain-containing protein n=1 Tax=Turnera subulata TaxID=218843 RepID=A0A9Q0GJI1_9ROSI|nr:hypothetical protein Tsubulata_016232 [Turnera subulata]